VKAYADSSFIVALYLQQQSTSIAAAFLQRLGEPLPFTPLHRLEVRNSIRAQVFRRQIDSAESKALLKQLEQDLRDQTALIHAPIDWVSAFREAERLSAAHGESIGCRSADVFHVAAAIDWGADRFLTFDVRQEKMAKAEGLVVGV
jgi:predicted nucleic acid-binding protein